MNMPFPALFSKHAGWIRRVDRSAARVGRGIGTHFVDDGGEGKPERVRSGPVVSMTRMLLRVLCRVYQGEWNVQGRRKHTDFHFFKALDMLGHDIPPK